MKKVVIALIIGWVMAFVYRFDTFYFIENMLSDNLTVEIREVDPRIKILAVDDESLEKIGKWPWPRGLMADTMEKLASNGALAVWPDMLFTEKSQDPSQDEALARVVEKYDNIYLPVYFEFKALQKSKEEMKHEYLKWPVIDIPEERVGHINVFPDNDKLVRKVLLGIPTLEGNIIPAIDVRLANLLLPDNSKITWNNNYVWQRGEQPISLDERLQVRFSYASPPVNSKFEIIPVWKVIEDQIDPAYFENSIVLIGPFTVGLEDGYFTPMSKAPMFGVEIHANIIQALLDNKLHTEASKNASYMIIILAGMLIYAVFEGAKARLGAIILALAIIVYSAVVYLYYTFGGVLLPYFYVIFAFILAYVISVVDQYLKERKQRDRVTETFGRYVSQKVLDEIISSGEEIKVGGVRKDVTLMFVDIRGFTPLSEKLEPEEVVNILNEYLDLCARAVFKFEGTLDKFIGDGVMSIFGAPIAQEDHAERAIQAALEMKRKSGRLSEEMEERYGRTVLLGIGINSGPAVIGNIGSHNRLDYTAIGDTVNLAARLVSYAKPGQILISSETYERVKDKFRCTALEPIKVKGTENPVQIYQVDGKIDEDMEEDVEEITEDEME